MYLLDLVVSIMAMTLAGQHQTQNSKASSGTKEYRWTWKFLCCSAHLLHIVSDSRLRIMTNHIQ